MNPSSSRSDGEPFGFLVARGPVAAATSATAWLQAMLDAEAALARAQADVGDITAADADAVAAACRAPRFDVESVFGAAELSGTPVIPLVAMLREVVGAPAAAAVHRGATSQDIFDTAAMLVVQRSGREVAARLTATAGLLDELAARHAGARMIGRTLLQHAVPTTFGTVTARWAAGVAASRDAIAGVALPVQCAGPVGDGSSFGRHAVTVVERMASRLELGVPAAAWHAQRTPIAAVAGAWGLAASAVAGIALDVVLLAQSDVGEVAEVALGAGRSSSMAHKRNPVAAVSSRAAAMQVPGLVATLLHSAGDQELERAAGAWHAEWPALNALLRATGSAVEWLATSIDRLVVDETRMAANLARSEEAVP